MACSPGKLHYSSHLHPYIHTIYSLGSATRQLDELQTSHKEELERTTSRMAVLERELAAAREAMQGESG